MEECYHPKNIGLIWPTIKKALHTKQKKTYLNLNALIQQYSIDLNKKIADLDDSYSLFLINNDAYMMSFGAVPFLSALSLSYDPEQFTPLQLIRIFESIIHGIHLFYKDKAKEYTKFTYLLCNNTHYGFINDLPEEYQIKFQKNNHIPSNFLSCIMNLFCDALDYHFDKKEIKEIELLFINIKKVTLDIYETIYPHNMKSFLLEKWEDSETEIIFNSDISYQKDFEIIIQNMNHIENKIQKEKTLSHIFDVAPATQVPQLTMILPNPSSKNDTSYHLFFDEKLIESWNKWTHSLYNFVDQNPYLYQNKTLPYSLNMTLIEEGEKNNPLFLFGFLRWYVAYCDRNLRQNGHFHKKKSEENRDFIDQCWHEYKHYIDHIDCYSINTESIKFLIDFISLSFNAMTHISKNKNSIFLNDNNDFYLFFTQQSQIIRDVSSSCLAFRSQFTDREIHYYFLSKNSELIESPHNTKHHSSSYRNMMIAIAVFDGFNHIAEKETDETLAQALKPLHKYYNELSTTTYLNEDQVTRYQKLPSSLASWNQSLWNHIEKHYPNELSTCQDFVTKLCKNENKWLDFGKNTDKKQAEPTRHSLL
jgi:hypothetical protein